MNKDISDLDQKAVDRATGLLQALMDDKVSDDTKARIQQWFVSDINIEAKYTALQNLFAGLRPNAGHDDYELRRYSEISCQLSFPQEARGKKSGLRMFINRYALRVAAVIIPAAVILTTLYLRNTGTVDPAQIIPVANVTVSVPEQGQKRIVLPDGSQVWINASGDIKYNDDFTRHRLVSLDGEAYFSVAADPSRPFRVVCGSMTVEVLGTEFNVRSRAGEEISEVTLTKGSVEVAAGKDRIELKPDETLTLDHNTGEYRIAKVSADTVSLWRVRGLYFNNTPIEEALRTVGMYHGREISIPEWKPTGDLINLDPDGELSLEQALDILRGLTGNFTYLITDNQVIITQTE